MRSDEVILTGDLVYEIALFCEQTGELVTGLALLDALDDSATDYDILQRAGRLRTDIHGS